jgi:Putative peptidoglycan binding domain
LQRSTSIQSGTGLNVELGISATLPGANVIFIPEAPVEIFGKEDLVSNVQDELKRVGCYGGDPDGVWGTSSRDALIKYYKTKKLKPTDTEPTEFHLGNLQGEDAIVCVYVPPKPAVAKFVPPKQVRRPAVERKAPAVRKAIAEKPRKEPKIAAANDRPRPRAASNTAPPPPPVPPKKSLADANIVGGFR